MKMIMAVEDKIESCYGATDVSKKCPYCKINDVIYDRVIFGVVTSIICKCGMRVYIEMLDLFYYKVW